MYNICCIGHITLDKVVTTKSTRHMPGGTSYYFANALQHLPVNLGLVTAVGKTEQHEVEKLQQQGTSVKCLPSEHSVYFENIYPVNQDHRTQRVLQKASPFTVEQLEDTEAEIFHLGPLLADDVSVDLIAYLAGKAKVSLDVQGFLREVRNCDVHAINWPQKQEALKHITFLKANEHEMEVLTGLTDIEAGARLLAEWGVTEVVITLGSMGSVIYANQTFYTIPAYVPPAVTDATGCGDTYMAGYLYKRVNGASINDAGNFAAAMAGLKIGGSGPFTGTETDVLEFMAS